MEFRPSSPSDVMARSGSERRGDIDSINYGTGNEPRMGQWNSGRVRPGNKKVGGDREIPSAIRALDSEPLSFKPKLATQHRKTAWIASS